MKYVNDDSWGFSIQGLRWIAKEDSVWDTKEKFGLEVAYKGQIKKVYYKNKKKRDEVFDKATAALRGEE
jgi:hypothetical protein